MIMMKLAKYKPPDLVVNSRSRSKRFRFLKWRGMISLLIYLYELHDDYTGTVVGWYAILCSVFAATGEITKYHTDLINFNIGVADGMSVRFSF